MDVVLLILALALAGMGGYLVADFIRWRMQGRIVAATITGFQASKNKGLKLPVVSFEKEKGQIQSAKTERIDRFLYIFDRPGEGEVITIIYLQKQPERARVFGMINMIAAVFLFAPLVALAALRIDNMELAGQVAYMIQFGLIILGGWVVLKFIQRNY